MLTQLLINNYAIAERIELHFAQGMTALTGETGAGKSIVLGALGLTLGDRADASVVRLGAASTDITAVFDIQNLPQAGEWLQAHELEADGDCILRRVINKDGRSRSYINGQPIPLNDLREIGSLLMDVHSQHQHQSLLNKPHQRHLLDEYAGVGELSRRVRMAYQRMDKARGRFQHAQDHHEERDARLQLLRYQVEELDQLGIDEAELQSLEIEQQTLSQGESLLKQVNLATQWCADDEINALDLVRRTIHQLESIPVAVPLLNDALALLNDAQIQLSEAKSNLQRFADSYEADPERLQAVEARLGAAFELARKHRISPEQLPTLHQRMASELAALDNNSESLAHLEAELNAMRCAFNAVAAELSEKRRLAAQTLETRVAEELTSLNMPATRFQVALTELLEGKEHGFEEVEFRISTNPGQAARAIGKVVSGGELSRISLAIQVVLAATSRTPTLVFDEVDVGIGGATAEVVGRLLRTLGARGQILCVTHLAQVASQAHQHLVVSKKQTANQTISTVESLNDQGRIAEVARMLGGIDLTEQTLAHASEMFSRGQATQH